MRIIIITTVLSTRVHAFEIKVSKEIKMLTENLTKYHGSRIEWLLSPFFSMSPHTKYTKQKAILFCYRNT
jgi:hypothetical protein